MNNPKKYGTFGGVFTPSILTILGVIMYMRLSWVVGSSGSLATAILIVLLAHIVSVSTGLSVSSVATDRKIQAGGIYYMLSRSLGLPIGGSIGITLFVATALSIALYLIGFAESALVVLQEPLGIEEITINHLRIVGSLALFVIVVIAFISTSIAIKSQYFILAAIGLSLISVFFGSTEGKEFDLSNVNQGDIGFSVLFGIFFPAVTGFTAGVAMSGDLKNAKKSIPWGTMLAVLTGLIIYVGLAVFIYFSIDTAILVSDKNALVKFGWIPVLVIAGIWGATLSSALGGILGAPRILQAMSVDSITPKLFAKGVGAENEPRNALLLTFVIAELGILVGELDVIAEVVAMFYMSAYLFINLSCLLEQWASPDFRPSFKIPLLIPTVGALATFLLMIQLNLAAALIAILVMVVIFLLLTRKQLVLGSGDVWLSVWSSVVKVGLKNLDKKSAHKRNWEPNVLLFSGGENNRDKLIQFSKAIAGKTGMISNFDLIENSTAKTLFPKHEQSIKDKELIIEGVFSRKQECKDVYLGIETIASTYGFSGVEPNTILLGWSKSSENPDNFIQLTQKLYDLDYNVLYIDYDKKRGFGNYKQIDVWWTDFSSTTELTLSLVKFLNKSLDWRHAQIRILFLSSNNENQQKTEAKIQETIENFRIKAEVKMIENEQGKSLYDIMKIESYDSDLNLVSIPSIIKNSTSYVDEINDLVNVLGTTLLIRASSNFDAIDITVEEEKVEEKVEIQKLEGEDFPTSIAGSYQGSKSLQNLLQFNSQLTNRLDNEAFAPIIKDYNIILDRAKKELSTLDNEFGKYFSNSSNVSNIKLLEEKKLTFLLEFIELIKEYNEDFVERHQNKISGELIKFNETYKSFIKQLPKKVKRAVSYNSLQKEVGDKFWIRSLKSWYRFKRRYFKLIPQIKVPFRDLVEYNYEQSYLSEFNKSLHHLNYFILNITNEINLVLTNFDNAYEELRSSKKITKEAHSEIIHTTELNIEQLKKSIVGYYQLYQKEFVELEKRFVQLIKKDAQYIGVVSLNEVRKDENNKKKLKSNERLLSLFASSFSRNNVLLNNNVLLECSLFKIRPELNKVNYQVNTNVKNFSISPKINQLEELTNILNEKGSFNSDDFKIYLLNYFNSITEMSIDNDELINSTIKKIDKIVYRALSVIEVMDKQSIQDFKENNIREVKTIKIQVQKLMLFAIQNKFVQAINKESAKLEQQLNDFIYDFKSKSKLIEAVNFNDNEELEDVLNEIKKEQQGLIDKINTRYTNFSSKLKDELNETYKILDFSFITGNIKQVNAYIKRPNIVSSKGTKKRLEFIKKQVSLAYKNSVDYINHQKDDYLISEFNNRNENLKNTVSKVLSFVQEVKTPQNVKDKIPFFYLKIFMGHHAAPVTIQNREEEVKEAELGVKAVQETGGAILVLGEKLTGKKYFSDYIATRIVKQKGFSITPIISNEKLEVSFDKSIETALGTNIKIEQYLEENNGLTLVFDDIEKWYLDLTIINRIKLLIENFGQKHFFILNCSIIGYNYCKQFISFENIVTSTILMKPLKRNEFVNTLKLKHKAGGINFILNNKIEKDIIASKRDALYQKYHNLYKGNIGQASLAWVNNIKEVKEELVFINEPKPIFFPDIKDNDWIILLKMFMLFGELSEVELQKAFGNKINYKKVLEQMQRANFILEPVYGVYEIIPEGAYFVEQYLKDKKVIA